MRVLIPLLLVLGSAAAVPAASAVFRRAAGDARAVLRQVERAEADYRASHGRYTASLHALGIEPGADVGVRITAEGGAGYSAVTIGADEECAVFHGRARAPRSYARTEGRIACRSR